jgi:hypothetical protein
MDQKRACVESIRGLVADDSYGSDNWLKRNLSSADNAHRSQAQELMPATFQGGAMALRRKHRKDPTARQG